MTLRLGFIFWKQIKRFKNGSKCKVCFSSELKQIIPLSVLLRKSFPPAKHSNDIVRYIDNPRGLFVVRY